MFASDLLRIERTAQDAIAEFPCDSHGSVCVVLPGVTGVHRIATFAPEYVVQSSWSLEHCVDGVAQRHDSNVKDENYA